MANSGPSRQSGSGSGKRRPQGTGNRKPPARRSGAPAAGRPAQRPGEDELAATESLSADERARERLSQPRSGTKRPPARGASRPGGRIDPRKGRPQGRSTGQTAGLFGGAFVVLAVVVIILISLLGSSSSGTAGKPIAAASAPASLVSALENIPASQSAAAGTGGSQVTVKGVFTPTPKQAPLTKDGKPLLVYIGAEYCPYCAASRWALVIALSRFGKFTGLQTIASTPYDVWANTRTLSFAKATYSSQYLVFDSTELTTNACAVAVVSNACPNSDYVRLQPLTSLGTTLTAKYDPQISIPFLDWGGKYVSSGALYLPTAINLGDSQTSIGWSPLSWVQILQNLTASPMTTAGQAILGTANVYTGAICDMTHDTPGSVCSLPAVKAAQAELAAS
jgi:hypothetical protein